MKFSADMLRLYAVTDRRWLNGQTLTQQVETAIQGGVTCIQLREKDLDPDAFLKQALEMRELCTAYHIPLIINDNAEIALKCNADGVHVGQKDMSPQKLRKLLGNDKIIGVSAATVAEAVEASQNGADYIGSGAVFHTYTKSNTRPVSHALLTQICQAASVPVVAIGGINAENADSLKNTGIAGIAVMSAIFAQSDIKAAAERLLSIAKGL